MNVIIILLILLATAGGIFYYVRKMASEDVDMGLEDILTLSSISKKVNDTLTATSRRSIEDMNLNSEQYKKQFTNREQLKNAIRESSAGDSQAKELLIRYIKDILTNDKICGITPDNIEKIIPFNHPSKMTSRIRFEILVYLWNREPDKNGKLGSGFTRNYAKYGLDKPTETEYGDYYDVTEEDIAAVFPKYMEERYGKKPMPFKDKVGFLAQYIFENLYGLGAIELLLETDLDEVEAGVSGIPVGKYEIKLNLEEGVKVHYSYESVWIIYHGLKTRISATTFGSPEELTRVCKNIYKYDAPYIMSQSKPFVVSTMRNGNRVTLARPMFADTYVGFIRKFDSAPSVEPEKLFMKRV